MDVYEVKVLTENGIHLAKKNNNVYCFSDIIIKINNNKIEVTSKITTIKEIQISMSKPFSCDARVLGDTWERMYGDAFFKDQSQLENIPWYFLAVDNDVTYAYGVRTQPNAMCYWKISYNMISLFANISSGSYGVLLNGKYLDVCEVVINKYKDEPFVAARKLCANMCSNPRSPKFPIYGGNDWYCNYGDTTYEKIIEHTKCIAECSPKDEVRPYMVIDDGWQINRHNNFNGGPWICNEKFGNMKKLAEEISSYGVLPGIWMRPLQTQESIPNDCILKSHDDFYILDPSAPKALELIKSNIKQIVKWGYKLLKLDFTTYDIFSCWGFEMIDNICHENVEFHDKSKTTAQIIKELYYTFREAAGDGVLLMGCNTLSHLSAGIFDIQRIGDDVSGLNWERTKKMGVNALAFRMCQHNTFYAVDADCVAITKDIPWERNIQWLDVLSKSGTPLFVSIAEDAYAYNIKSAIKEAFKRVAKYNNISKPTDWMESLTPSMWESDYGTDTYIW